MTYKENVLAILRCNFAGFREELMQEAADRINELERTGSANPYSHWIGNLYFGRYPNEARFICANCESQMNIMTRYCPYCGCRMEDVE